MFRFITRLFHAKEKAVDVTSINDRDKYISNYLIHFNSNSYGQLFQSKKW
ncbi:hypothetical protein [Apilactobacillus quenuiae]|nr:hypothetical protein [Apilactobacillus quenuiae]